MSVPAPAAAVAPRSGKPVRGTQSFVGTLSSVWSRPSLLAIELAWRWLFGGPALLLVCAQLRKLLLQSTGGTLDPGALGLRPAFIADPVGSLAGNPLATSAQIGEALGRVLPQLRSLGLWLLPSLLVAWLVLASLGRTAMLRRADPSLAARPATLAAWYLLRICAIAAMFSLWFNALAFAGSIAIVAPTSGGGEPNFVLFCAIVIVGTLGLFTLWGFLGWFTSIAPIVAMTHDLGFAGSLRAAARIGPLRGKLVEINLVMGIVKIALLVLAMVFTATPLPFESVATATFLFWWWIGVMILYFIASDFFHVARLIGYLQLYRRYEREGLLPPRHALGNDGRLPSRPGGCP